MVYLTEHAWRERISNHIKAICWITVFIFGILILFILHILVKILEFLRKLVIFLFIIWLFGNIFWLSIALFFAGIAKLLVSIYSRDIFSLIFSAFLIPIAALVHCISRDICEKNDLYILSSMLLSFFLDLIVGYIFISFVNGYEDSISVISPALIAVMKFFVLGFEKPIYIFLVVTISLILILAYLLFGHFLNFPFSREKDKR